MRWGRYDKSKGSTYEKQIRQINYREGSYRKISKRDGKSVVYDLQITRGSLHHSSMIGFYLS